MGRIFLYSSKSKVHTVRSGDAPYVPHFVLMPSQLDVINDYYKSSGVVNVCSVNNFHPEMLDSPAEMLGAMQSVLHCPSNGGWRRLEPVEYAALQVADARPVIAGADPIRLHPALRSGLGFATGNVLTTPMIEFLADVFDIRRFAVTDKPLACSKIRSFYHLISHETIYQMQIGGCKRVHKSDRVTLPLTAWRWCCYYRADLRTIVETPNAFLHRYYRAALPRLEEKHGDRTNAVALLMTTRRFVDFATLLWRDGIGDIKFDPERFFTREDEVEEFRKYTKNFDFLTDFS